MSIPNVMSVVKKNDFDNISNCFVVIISPFKKVYLNKLQIN